MLLTLSQTTNFRLFQTGNNNSKFDENSEKVPKGKKTEWEKEKLLIMSNCSFHSVFKILVLQTLENKGLFGKRLIFGHGQILAFDKELRPD